MAAGEFPVITNLEYFLGPEKQAVGASLIHAYLSLYAISGERKFLIYLEKYVPILEILLKGDTSYDLLSGNAGAILVLLRLF